MTQSKGPLTTSFWFQVHISYRFGGDSRTKLHKISQVAVRSPYDDLEYRYRLDNISEARSGPPHVV